MNERVTKRVDELKRAYLDGDVCMFDLLADEKADGLTMEEAVKVYAVLMGWAENDRLYRINHEDGFVEDIANADRTDTETFFSK